MPAIPIKQTGKSLVKNRAEALDSVLTFLFLSENKDSWDWISGDRETSSAVSRFQKVPLTHFDGANVTFLYESLLGTTTSYERMFYDFTSETNIKDLKELPWSWESIHACLFEEVLSGEALESGVLNVVGKTGSTYLFTLTRIRSVPLKSVRGLFKLRSSYVFERTFAHVFNDGTYTSERWYMQYFSGAWYVVGIPMEVDPPMRIDEAGQGEMWANRSFALTEEYDWSVHVGFNKQSVPTVSLPSDPIGAREVFKLRDVPPGKTRRDALKHWVNGHNRNTVAPGYVETYIWPYLRGAEEFTWNGLYCKIQPSVFDIRKAKEFQMMKANNKLPMI